MCVFNKNNLKRNFDKIEFESIRKVVDKKFNDLHDELSDAYYNYWKKGLSKPFIYKGKTFDVQDNPDDTKALFDELHGIVFCESDLEFDKYNKSLPIKEQISEDKYKFIKDSSNNVIRNNLDLSKKKLSEFKSKHAITDEEINPSELVYENKDLIVEKKVIRK